MQHLALHRNPRRWTGPFNSWIEILFLPSPGTRRAGVSAELFRALAVAATKDMAYI